MIFAAKFNLHLFLALASPTRVKCSLMHAVGVQSVIEGVLCYPSGRLFFQEPAHGLRVRRSSMLVRSVRIVDGS